MPHAHAAQLMKRAGQAMDVHLPALPNIAEQVTGAVVRTARLVTACRGLAGQGNGRNVAAEQPVPHSSRGSRGLLRSLAGGALLLFLPWR